MTASDRQQGSACGRGDASLELLDLAGRRVGMQIGANAPQKLEVLTDVGELVHHDLDDQRCGPAIEHGDTPCLPLGGDGCRRPGIPLGELDPGITKSAVPLELAPSTLLDKFVHGLEDPAEKRSAEFVRVGGVRLALAAAPERESARNALAQLELGASEAPGS